MQLSLLTQLLTAIPMLACMCKYLAMGQVLECTCHDSTSWSALQLSFSAVRQAKGCVM